MQYARFKPTGQIIKNIPLQSETRQLVKAMTGKDWITPRSKCPCGSGKKFKACCYKLNEVEFQNRLKRALKAVLT